MELNEIERMLTKGASTLMPDEKKAIRSECKRLELNIAFASGCPNCYHDALVLLRKHYKYTADHAETPANGRRWRWVGGNPVMWNGRILMDENTPDEIVDEFVKYHPMYYERND